MRVLPGAILILCFHLLEGIAVWDQPGHLLRPNLLLLPVIYFALWFPIHQAVFAAIAAGLLRDVYSVDPFGLSGLSFGVAAVAVSSLREEVFREHPLTQILLAGLVALIPAAFTLGHVALTGSPAGAAALLRPSLIQALQTALFAPLFIIPLQSMGSIFGKPDPYRY